MVHYLDATGAARPRPEALLAIERGVRTLWADPHRDHAAGRAAAQGLQSAREVIAGVVGARRQDVVVTSSLTQALHHGIGAMAAARRARHGARIILPAAVRTSALHAAEFFGEPDLVRVGSSAAVDLDDLRDKVASGPAALIVSDHVNVETGAISPVAEVLAAAHEAAAPVLIDAGSSLGRTDLPDDWDALALDAGEWGAGFRLGFLVTRSRVRMRPTWPEDADAWFPGGVSPSLAFAAAVALEAMLANRAEEDERLRALTRTLRRELSSVSGVTLVGDESRQRAPHIVALALHGVDGEAAARALARHGYAVGTGSACTSSTIEPNHVLRAMGVDFDGHLRVTLDHMSSDQDVQGFAATVQLVLSELAAD